MQNTLIKSPPEFKQDFSNYELPEDIMHLLSRSLFGLTSEQKKSFFGKKKKEIIEDLLVYEGLPKSLPVKDYDTINSSSPDQKIKIGQTWVYDFNHDIYINEKRKLSLKNWVADMLYGDNSLSVGPRMFLFWCNFFGLETRKIAFTSRAFQHYNIISRGCLGNYAELLTRVVTDPAFLNYYQRLAPKGRKISEYTTEQILARYILGPAAAENISKEKKKRLIRLLNKWWIISDLAFLHDRSAKNEQSATEPSRFMEAYLDRADARDIKTEIEYVLYTIIDQPVSAQYLTERVYQFFLGGPVDHESREHLIIPVALDFSQGGYDIQPWLRSLFTNKYFYDKRFIGSLVKGPVDFVFRICKTMDLFNADDRSDNSTYAEWLRHKCALQGLDICDPPDNNGWAAIADNNYHQSWLTPVAMTERRRMVNRLLFGDTTTGNEQMGKKVLALCRKCVNPSNAFQLVRFLLSELICKKQPATYVQALAVTFLESGPEPWSSLWEMASRYKEPSSEKMVIAQLSTLLNYVLMSPDINYY